MYIKRFFSSIIALVTVVSMTFAPTHDAYAQFVTVEAGPNLFTNFVTTGESVWSTITKEVLEPIVEDFANKALDKVIDSTLNWAFDEGFEGQPGFINNYKDLIGSVGSGEILKSVNQAILAFDEAYTEYVGSEQFIQDNIEAQQNAQQGSSTGVYTYDTALGDCDGDGEINAQDFDDPVLSGGSYQNCQDYNPPPPPPTTDDDDEDYEYDDSGGDCDCDGVSNSSDPDFPGPLSESAYSQTCYDYGTSCNQVQDAVNAGQAQANYEGFQSRFVRETRNTAQVLARIGKEQLNEEKVKALIRGDGFTLDTVIGDNYRQFGQDIKQGGWLGYIELGDPHNNPTGKELLVKNALIKQVTKETGYTREELNLPTLLLSRKECAERDPNNSDPKTNCLKTTVNTPGEVVAQKVFKGATKDETQAENADGLIIRLLKNSLGKLTDGLINRGFAKLTGAIAKEFEVHGFGSVSGQGGPINVDYSSGHSIVTANTPGAGGFNEITPQPGIQGEVIEFDSYGPGSNYWVGGPEHLGPNWNDKPDILVNFQKELEINHRLASTEQEYLADVKSSLKGSVKVVSKLDHCIPGPDLGWEERWRDKISFDDSTKQDRSDIALFETAEMALDKRMAIPGAYELRNSIDVIFEDSVSARAAVRERLKSIKQVTNNTLTIKNFVEKKFNLFIQGIPEYAHLELFEEDWYDWREINFVEFGEAGNPNYDTDYQDDLRDLLTSLATYSPSDEIAPYFIFDPLPIDLTNPPLPGEIPNRESWTPDLENEFEVGLAVDWFLENRPEDVYQSQSNMAWDIWRGVLPSNLGYFENDGLTFAEEFAEWEEEKSRVRFEFEVLRTDFSNRQLVQRALNEKVGIERALVSTDESLHDCRVFKAYALGAPESYYHENYDTSEPLRDLAEDNEDYGVWSESAPFNDASHFGVFSSGYYGSAYPRAPISKYAVARYNNGTVLPYNEGTFVDNGIGYGLDTGQQDLMLSPRTVTFPISDPSGSPNNGGISSYWWGNGDNESGRSYAFAYSSVEFAAREVPSDDDVLDFIQAEYENQSNNLPSYFKTQAMTAPSNIELSIFGYSSFGIDNPNYAWPMAYVADKYIYVGGGGEYNQTSFVIGGLNSRYLWSTAGSWQDNSNILKRMYYHDDMGFKWTKESGSEGQAIERTGTLYCRNGQNIKFLGPERWGSQTIPACIAGWYRSNEIDYHKLINGI